MTLDTWIHSYLGGVAAELGWTVLGNSYAFMVSETLRLYGVATEAEATDADKLYTIAKVVAWETVIRELSMDYDYSADGASFKRSQMVEQARENLIDAQFYALDYLQVFIKTGNTIGNDPYDNTPYPDKI